MAFDCYVAICDPLHYATVLSREVIIRVGLAVVLRGFSVILPDMFLVKRLPFCHSNVLPHTYCEHMAVAKFACADIRVNVWYGLSALLSTVVIDALHILVSYTFILNAVFRLPSRGAWQKALGTCGSHLGFACWHPDTSAETKVVWSSWAKETGPVAEKGNQQRGAGVQREPSGSLPAHRQWTEDQRGRISSSVIETRIEEGPQRSSEGTFREGVDEGAMVYMPPAAPSSNKENLSLPFQDTFHLLRRKETESKIWSHWFTTETSVLWVTRCHPEVHRTLLCPIPLGQGPKDTSDQLGTKGMCGCLWGKQKPSTGQAIGISPGIPLSQTLRLCAVISRDWAQAAGASGPGEQSSLQGPIPFLPVRASMLRPHLVLLSSLLNGDHGVVTVFLGLGTHPAKRLPIFLTKQVKFLSVHHTQLALCALLGILADFSKILHHVGHLSIGPEVPEQEVVPAHRTDAAPIFPNLRDAFLAEAVTTFDAHGLHHGIQADSTRDLLPHHCQGHC
eukprot:bmy_03643T0